MFDDKLDHVNGRIFDCNMENVLKVLFGGQLAYGKLDKFLIILINNSFSYLFKSSAKYFIKKLFRKT